MDISGMSVYAHKIIIDFLYYNKNVSLCVQYLLQMFSS